MRRAAAEFGDRELLVLPSDPLTFGEAERASRVLARRLLAAGIGKGTRVGLHFGYSPEFVVAFLAITRIGALAAPLSTSYAPGELRTALRRADIDTLLIPPHQLGRDELAFVEQAVPELRDATDAERLRLAALPFLRRIWVLGPAPRSWAASVDVTTDAGAVDEALLEAAEAEVSPADLLVVIQTSGTTAEPKGVLHTHGAVFRKTAAGPGVAGPIFLAMPFFWVGGLLSMCAALQSGTTLIVQERFEPNQALDLIEQHRATTVASWFTVMQALRTHPSVPDRDLSCIPMLTREPGAVPYVIPLGMTETFGPHMTFPHPEYGMDPPRDLWGSNGVTAPGFEHQLVDPETGAVVEGDGEGEIWVRGPGVTVGLYKREREEVFDADGWLHTGDRVRRRSGLWWFVGRTTEMIKVRGSNVAPPEVEAVLEASPDVEHAFVLGLPRPEFEEQVAAVVVPRAGAAIDVDELRAHARHRLSSYKVPTVVMTIAEDEVPWLGTGKPDKRALRARLESA